MSALRRYPKRLAFCWLPGLRCPADQYRLSALWRRGLEPSPMTGRRQSRLARRLGVRVKVTPRDEALLRALARFGIASTAQLTALLFPAVRRDTASARLRRAFDGGLVDVRASDRAKPNLYTLGPRGRAWALDQGLAVAPVPRGDVQHHLGIVAVWTVLAAACHADPSARLARFTPDWELRRRPQVQVWPVVPDALVELRLPSGRLDFALEFDRGGERAREWRRKLDGYRLWFGTDPEQARQGLVVVFEGGPGRAAGLSKLLGDWPNWQVLQAAPDLGRLLPRVIELGSPYALPLRQGEAPARNSMQRNAESMLEEQGLSDA